MAGAYLDAPSRRMAIDADLSEGYITYVNYDNMYQVSTANWAKLNDNNGTTDGASFSIRNGSDHYIGIWFPEEREIDGFFYAYGSMQPGGSSSEPFDLVYSDDATNLRDGTWTTAIADVPDVHWPTPHAWRQSITSLALTTVRSLRLRVDNAQYGRANEFHVYGTISPGETLNRILFLDAEASDVEFGKPLDWGDVGRGEVHNHTIKLKNNSSTLTANTVQITAEDLWQGSGGWYTFSLNGVDYSSTQEITSIANGASTTVYVKLTCPTGSSNLGPHAARAKVTTTSWS